MEDTKPHLQELSPEELSERQYKKKETEIRIARMRAAVVRSEITEAYQIIERIRFDYVSDTAFRDKVVRAKRELENALGDFLLDDHYWKGRKERLQEMTHQEYNKILKNPTQPTQGPIN